MRSNMRITLKESPMARKRPKSRMLHRPNSENMLEASHIPPIHVARWQDQAEPFT
jgi:hypothetical protein